MKRFRTPEAEILRIKSKYRRLLLEGKFNIPLDSARKLLGPDCAFHLYRIQKSRKEYWK